MANEVANFEGMEGQGFDNMNGSSFSLPMLLIAQPTSSVVTAENATIKVGEFYNSVTGESFGKEVQIIPCYYKPIYLVWKPNMGGLVGRHEIGSIKTTGDIYTGLKDSEGNTVEENWVYYVMIAGHEDQGVFQFSLKSSAIKYAKKWNSLINFTKLANGKPAPFFSSIWNIKSVRNENDKGTWYTIGNAKECPIERVDFISQEQLTEVLSIREFAPTLTVIAATEDGTQLALEDKTEEDGKY